MYFDYKLPEIFESLNSIYTNHPIESEKNNFKEKVKRILNIWNDWSIYDWKFLMGLEAIFFKRKEHFKFNEKKPENDDEEMK